jgi:competence protein ComEA
MPTRVLLVALGLAAGAFALWHPAPRTAVQSVKPVGRAPAFRAEQTAVVYVAGAVRRPGLYRFASEARVDDAVRAAGGLRSDADPVAVNLAAKIEDGEEIAVPRKGESLRSLRAVRSRGTAVRRSTRRHAAALDTVLDLNVASADELAAVPGIGPAVAARIEEMRTTEGPFHTLDELLDVAGMTQSKLDRAAPYLRI